MSKTDELWIRTATNVVDEVSLAARAYKRGQGVCNALPPGELPRCNDTKRIRDMHWGLVWEYAGGILWDTPIPPTSLPAFEAKLHNMYWMLTNNTAD